MNYDWKITLKKFVEAAGPGVAIGAIGGAMVALNLAMGMLENLNGEMTVSRIGMIVVAALASAVVGGLTGALKALQNYLKNRAGTGGINGPFDGAAMLLFVGLGAAIFPGCMSLAPYSSGALSSNNVRVSESVSTEYGKDTFNIEVKSRGEAAAKTGLDYSAGGESPWRFVLNGEANVNSVERVQPLTQGAGAALAKLPDTLGPLVQMLATVQDAPSGTPSGMVRDRIIQMIMDKVMGAITGGLTGIIR